MGRPTNPNKDVNAGIYCSPADLDFLLTWNAGNSTLAFRELIAEIRKVRPGGRYSAPKVDPAARNAPGTKTSLKREIKALRAALVAAGVDPDTIS